MKKIKLVNNYKNIISKETKNNVKPPNYGTHIYAMSLMLLFVILYSVTVFDFRKAIKKAIHGAKFGQAPKRNDLWGFAPIVKVSRDITTEIMEMWQDLVVPTGISYGYTPSGFS